MDTADSEEPVDPREVLAALNYRETSEPQRVEGGVDTLLWCFKTPDGREHSLRVYHLPRLRKNAWRERVALATCAEAGLPAPRVETVGQFQDLPAMVLSWCPGAPILDFVEKRPWTLWRLGRLSGQMQARLHAVPPPTEFVPSAPDDWVSRVTERYTGLADRVRALGLSTSSLIHMDFHPLNIISDGATITGIIDWAGAAAGDPRADFARTMVTMLWAPIPPGPLRLVGILARGIILRAWSSGYKESVTYMPDYRPFMAWAGATLLAELEFLIGSPDAWITERDLERLRRLIDTWARDDSTR